MPVTIYEGEARALNNNEYWHPTYNFSSFSKIEMYIFFLGQKMVLQFNPSSDSTTHSFGFNMYHPTDGGVRIVAGKLSFAGRYITNIEIKFSVAGSSYTDLGASYINVVKIVGYK